MNPYDHEWFIELSIAGGWGWFGWWLRGHVDRRRKDTP